MTIKTIITCVSLCLGLVSFGQHVPGDSTAVNTNNPENAVTLYAPNAFTPDGDYFNDSWKVYIEGIDIYDFHLTVFDRTGQVIWESYNTTGEWDGYFGGDQAPDGIYPYVIETKDQFTDERYQFTGFVTILR